jgi:hypothetical protein
LAAKKRSSKGKKKSGARKTTKRSKSSARKPKGGVRKTARRAAPRPKAASSGPAKNTGLCLAKCPNCDNGACSKDAGHAGWHWCNYDEKPF